MPTGLVIPALLLGLALAGGLTALWLGARANQVDRQIQRIGQTPAPPLREAPGHAIRRQAAQAGRSRAVVDVLIGRDPNGPGTWPVSRLLVSAGIVGVIVTGLVHMVAPLWMAAIPGLAGVTLCLRGLYGFQRRRYANRLIRQLPDTIQLVVSAVRAGMPATEAFRIVAHSMPDPTREQFGHVVNDIGLGRAPEDALLEIFQRTRLAEYAIFSVTLSVQSKAGGKLAETLQIMADTVRDRINLAGRAKALAAEATLSARVLTALPFVAGALLSLERPGYLRIFLVDPRGHVLLIIGLSLLGAGTLAMRYMIRKGTTV